MSKPYRLVVFDWEGTLGLDTLSQVLKVLNDAAMSLGLGAIDLLMARKYVGFGLIPAIKRLFPGASLHQQEVLFSTVNSSLNTAETHSSIIHGAFQLVEHAFNAGYFLAIATNKGQQSLNRVLRVSGIDKYITVSRCAGQVPAKPCPQMLQELMDIFDVKSEETLMIGDSVFDMEMAHALDVDSIGVDINQLSIPELLTAGAQMVCTDYSQLAAFLQL